MKAFYGTSKEILKKMMVFGLISLLAFSCGKSDKGGDNNNQAQSPFQFLNQGQTAQVSQLYQQLPCQSGRMPEITLGLAGGAQGNAISGNLTPNIVGGSPIGTYIGVNYQMGAVMVITQMSNGGQQQSGFNVTLSLCREVNQYNPNDYIIHEQIVNSGTTQFQLPYAVLGQGLQCPSHPVYLGSVIFNVPNLGNVKYDFAPQQGCQ